MKTPENKTYFPSLRVGSNPEEQLQLNQPAMNLLEEWIHQSANEPPVDSDEELADFQKVIDSHRPIGQKVFSASESVVSQ
jgi:hypothetical protein